MAEDEWVYVSKAEWDAQKGSYELLDIVAKEYFELRTEYAQTLDMLRDEQERVYHANVHAARLGEDNHRLADELADLEELLQRTWDAWRGATKSQFDALKDDLRRAGVDVDRYDERAKDSILKEVYVSENG